VIAGAASGQHIFELVRAALPQRDDVINRHRLDYQLCSAVSASAVCFRKYQLPLLFGKLPSPSFIHPSFSASSSFSLSAIF